MRYRDDLEKVVRYLGAEMQGEELVDFEKRLDSDPELMQELEKQKLLDKAFKLYGSRKQLKASLQEMHQEMDQEQTTNVVSFKAYGLKTFWKKHMPTMAVAASVALITVLCSVLMLDYLQSFEDRQMSFYQELKQDLDLIKKTQNKMSKAAAKKAAEAKPSRYSGTGFVISPNGYLLTNHHLVKNADSIYIESRLENYHRYKVKMVYKDPETDLAVLKVDDPAFVPFKNLPYAFRTNDADLGEAVFTLAFPRVDMVYGEGSVSSRTGFEGDTSAYQVSIPVNPGNSGGPLLDENGYLIGVITGRNVGVEGAAFAVKARHIIDLINEIPKDSLAGPIALPKRNLIRGKRRPEQIKEIQDMVFNVKVYSNQGK
jgi:serine protease Do